MLKTNYLATQSTMRKNISAIAACLAISGCGLLPPQPKIMYSGAQRDLSEVASVSEGSRLFLQVLKVDGQYIVDPSIGAARFTKGVHILPGERKITVRYQNVPSFSLYGLTRVETSIAEIILNAKAGHSYMLYGARRDDKYDFWFVDKGVNYNQDCLLDTNFAKMVFRGETVAGC